MKISLVRCSPHFCWRPRWSPMPRGGERGKREARSLPSRRWMAVLMAWGYAANVSRPYAVLELQDGAHVMPVSPVSRSTVRPIDGSAPAA